MSGGHRRDAHGHVTDRRRPAWMRAVDRVSDVCGVIAATMILVAVLLTCQMIWVRYVANASTVWQTETVIYLMIGATMIGLPYVQRVRGHVSVDLLPNLLPPAGRRALAVFVLLLSIAVCGVMFRHAFELWHLAFDRGWRTETVWGPPQWIPYVGLPIGFGLFVVQLATDLVGVALGFDDAAPLDEAALAVRDTGGTDEVPSAAAPRVPESR